MPIRSMHRRIQWNFKVEENNVKLTVTFRCMEFVPNKLRPPNRMNQRGIAVTPEGVIVILQTKTNSLKARVSFEWMTEA